MAPCSDPYDRWMSRIVLGVMVMFLTCLVMFLAGFVLPTFLIGAHDAWARALTVWGLYGG